MNWKNKVIIWKRGLKIESKRIKLVIIYNKINNQNKLILLIN